MEINMKKVKEVNVKKELTNMQKLKIHKKLVEFNQKIINKKITRKYFFFFILFFLRFYSFLEVPIF